MCADYRKDGSTFWVTLSNGATRKRRADPIWGRDRQRRVSSAWSRRSVRKPSLEVETGNGAATWAPATERAGNRPAYLLWLPRHFRSEERRVGKECRSRWSPYH